MKFCYLLLSRINNLYHAISENIPTSVARVKTSSLSSTFVCAWQFRDKQNARYHIQHSKSEDFVKIVVKKMQESWEEILVETWIFKSNKI